MTESAAGPSGRDGPHVFVVDVDAPVLDDDDRHHVARVLRLRRGDSLTVSDGSGRWRVCRLGPALEPVGAVHSIARPAPPLTLAMALTKGERPELAVQKVTELGVDRVVLFVAERSVPRWDDDRARRQLHRLRRVSREAAMQSRRVWLPLIEGPATFAEVAGLDGVALADRDGEPPALARPTILVGPEGGWADAERRCGLPTVGLGPLVLRAETAAVTAVALLAALRLGLVGGV